MINSLTNNNANFDNTSYRKQKLIFKNYNFTTYINEKKTMNISATNYSIFTNNNSFFKLIKDAILDF